MINSSNRIFENLVPPATAMDTSRLLGVVIAAPVSTNKPNIIVNMMPIILTTPTEV